MYLGGFMNAQAEGKKALKELLEKGIDLVAKITELNKGKRDILKMVSDAVWKLGSQDSKKISESEKQELIETVKKYFEQEEVIKDVKPEGKVEETKKLIVWDAQVLADLDFATSAESDLANREIIWKSLNERGYFMKPDDLETNKVFEAISLLTGHGNDFGKKEFGDDTDAAEKFLREYFGVDIDPNEVVQKTAVSEKNENPEKKRIEAIQAKYREMSEEVVFSRFEGWITSKGSRGGEELRGWKTQMTTLAVEERERALNQLRMTLMLFENSEMRVHSKNNSDYWIKTGMGILRSLNLEDKV